ncbi:16S rRNA (cytosine(1402)-N(4))-methyltransferase RsmH [Litoreibacter roseus]|uniref:Ribosomal RNA small subunit methyltransferase H n=1 Tax=Litoreibacter roseus TaxID=2601869 RepID=A0A6N6JBU5_9RHOB|nr:16S rRNA (cytosine(1402)-N(4))-methyltransferase RsmH [Litoreibacter roseus]GFE63544.1 ribosomal RNA small subunit methyltransferase H [Litoreibacter roseus]
MIAAASDHPEGAAPHLPVLIDAILERVECTGTWLDGTFGAGGYARALLDAGATSVIGIDRDPLAFEMAAPWADTYDRLTLIPGVFSQLDILAGDHGPLSGVVLDLGVSSMQLDRAERGFSFLRDGPLDMRMGQDGPSAADLINTASEDVLADILFQYGEERASRRIAKAIIAARPLSTTGQLVTAIEGVLPKGKPGQSHQATRSFQAIRIAINDELGEVIGGLEAAERALAPGGYLAVVTFHSLEDRVVKKFFASRAGRSGGGNRYAPETKTEAATFEPVTKRAVVADADELARNPRSRSAKLRIGRRTQAPARAPDRAGLGLPKLVGRSVL